MSKIIIGVMGKGDRASAEDMDNAYELGKLIARQGWVLLTGGRNVGVMNAASKGAKEAGGLTIGILQGKNKQNISEAVDIAIATGMSNARNNINVLSSDVVIACGMGLGTASEVALALKNNKPAILLNPDPEARQFFTSLAPEKIEIANTPQEAIDLSEQILIYSHF